MGGKFGISRLTSHHHSLTTGWASTLWTHVKELLRFHTSTCYANSATFRQTFWTFHKCINKKSTRCWSTLYLQWSTILSRGRALTLFFRTLTTSIHEFNWPRIHHPRRHPTLLCRIVPSSWGGESSENFIQFSTRVPATIRAHTTMYRMGLSGITRGLFYKIGLHRGTQGPKN